MKNVLTPKEEEALLREVYDNFPEASACLRCASWDYDNFRFRFHDPDEDKFHTVTLTDAKRGLRLFITAISRGELKGLGLPAHYLTDTGCWNAWAFDAVNQMAIFGEVIYG
jgi:hypothetical protein